MVFTSLDDLVHMGGHGFYVWMAYGLGIACLVALVTMPLLEHSRVLADIARRARRDATLRGDTPEDLPEGD